MHMRGRPLLCVPEAEPEPLRQSPRGRGETHHAGLARRHAQRTHRRTRDCVRIVRSRRADRAVECQEPNCTIKICLRVSRVRLGPPRTGLVLLDCRCVMVVCGHYERSDAHIRRYFWIDGCHDEIEAVSPKRVTDGMIKGASPHDRYEATPRRPPSREGNIRK